MLRNILAAINSGFNIVCVKLHKLVTPKNKPVKPAPETVPLTPEELLRENEAAVKEAGLIGAEFAALTPAEQLRLHNGVYAALLIQQVAEEVVNFDRLWNGLVLADLRPTVGKLRRSAFRLRQGRTRSAYRHVRDARQLLCSAQDCCRRAASRDRGLMATFIARSAALAQKS